MDAFGPVNNSRYFTGFEQARIVWLRSTGFPHGLVPANVGCTFVRGIVYPAVLGVSLYGANAGGPPRKLIAKFATPMNARSSTHPDTRF